MKLETMIGKEFQHRSYGKVLVTGVPKGSKKYVYIKVIQRKQGWNEATGHYEPIKKARMNPTAGPGAVTVYYETSRGDEYGMEDKVHINELTNDSFAKHFQF